MSRQLAGMAQRQLGLTKVLKHVERGPRRSTLFYWMVEHHDRLIRSWPSHGVVWSELSREFDALGLTDRNGRKPSVKCSRQTWERARTAVQKHRAREAAQSAKSNAGPSPKSELPPMRSGTTAFWPPAQARQPMPLPSPPVSGPAGQSGVETEAEADARAEANIQRIKNTIYERAGRAPPKGVKS